MKILALCGLLFLSLISPGTAHAEVYLTKDQALDLVLGKQVEHIYQPQLLSKSVVNELRKNNLARDSQTKAHFFVAKDKDHTTGYALIDQEVGKHLPISYIVGLSRNGEVTRVEMMVFREIRGWEARERRFMKQFEGKQLENDLSIGSALKNVSGATLSSRAIAKGVKRALYLWNHFYAADKK